jgi:two-component sensor histidine kinase/PAS domain-containing protein
MSEHWHHHYRSAYVLAGVAIAASFGVRAALTPLLGHGSIFLIYLPAMILVAFAGGRSPTFAAIFLSTVLGLSQSAYQTSAIGLDSYFQALLHIICGLFIVFVAENWRRVYARLHDALRSSRALLHEVRASETEFRLQSSQLKLALEAGQLGTWQYDLASEQIAGSSTFWASLGLSESDQDISGIQEVIVPEDFDALTSALQQAEVNSQHPIDKNIRARLPDGSCHTINLRGRLTNSSGRSIVVGVSVDITIRRHAETARAISAQDKILIEELVHRIKNLFPVILSVVRLTSNHYDDVTRYQQALIKRLRVLEAIHSLLAQDVDRTASIDKLVLLELALFQDDDRVSLKGPPILLMEGSAESFSMIVHELATNSTKYGALACPQGRLDVRWHLKDATAGGPMIFEWIESNTNPPKTRGRTGYGSSIIGATGPPLIGEFANLEFTPDGIRYALIIPRGKFSTEPAVKRVRRGTRTSSQLPFDVGKG